MLIISLALSGVFVLVLFRLAGTGEPRHKSMVVGTAFLAIPGGFFFCMSAPLTLIALLVFLATSIGLFSSSSPRVFRNWILRGTALAYLILGGFAINQMRDIPRLRARYPLESMTERLAYETRGGRSIRLDQPLNEQADLRLRNHERQLGMDNTGSFFLIPGGHLPERNLEDLHRSYVHHFVNSPGFGVGRMIRADYRRLDLPYYQVPQAPESLTLPPPAYDDPNREKDYHDPWADGKATTSVGPSRDNLQKFHIDGLFNFSNHGHFGYIRNRNEVAGFRPHRFSAMPTFDRASAWKLDSLELISLLKHAEPVAYVSRELPRMDKLREAPVRPLTEHERAMLDGLRRGEDLQVRSVPDRIRMLGAIRAAEQCQRCHEVERGALLGAFSYKLRVEQ